MRSMLAETFDSEKNPAHFVEVGSLRRPSDSANHSWVAEQRLARSLRGSHRGSSAKLCPMRTHCLNSFTAGVEFGGRGSGGRSQC